MDQSQAKFEGWAVIELFGHSKEAGYVTTQYFGDKAMFQVDVPALEEREYEIERPEWGEVDGRERMLPAGTKVRRSGTAARSRIVSPGAVYAMNPATEELVRRTLDRSMPRPLIVLELPKSMQLPGEPTTSTPSTESSDDDYEPEMEPMDDDDEAVLLRPWPQPDWTRSGRSWRGEDPW